MANQSNYPDKINSLIDLRPSRLTSQDFNFLSNGKKSILFGTHPKDKIELWLYNPDGTFSTHANIPLSNDSLGLSTIVDNTGAFEFLDMNLQKIANLIGIEPGRYSLVANFIRDEIGSEETYQLSIQEISDDRTELKVTSTIVNESVQKDICEFITPSVPKVFAQALVDQTFGVASQQTTLPDELLTVDVIVSEIHSLISQFIQRSNYANADVDLQNMLTTVITRTRTEVINNIVKDIDNLQVQQTELIQYVIDSLVKVIYDMKQKNEIDNRFEII